MKTRITSGVLRIFPTLNINAPYTLTSLSASTWSALLRTHRTTLTLRWNYAEALYKDTGATLDDLRESVETLKDLERTARRVLGGAHPTTTGIELELQKARAALDTHETPSDSA